MPDFNSGKTIALKLAKKLLRFVLRDDLLEEVEGDLDEKFRATASSKSLARAKLNYWYQVLHYLRPFALKRFRIITLNNYPMLESYFKIGWRNLLKNKGHSCINIGGLAAGMTVALLIGLWLHDEITFNHYHTRYERVGRVMRNGTLNGETFTSTYLPRPLAEELRSKYGASFRHVVSASLVSDHVISDGKNKFVQKGEFIEPDGPEMFSLRMLKGSIAGLKEQNSILLSESAARMLFGDGDPMDKLVVIDTRMNAKVTGVYEDLPHNSHFSGIRFFAPWDLYTSYNTWIQSQGFGNNMLDVYVELAPKVTFGAASYNIKDVILDNIAGDKEYVAANPQIFVHPMDRWHLHGEWKNGLNAGGRIKLIWMFGMIGAFVLALACINFMNLSTARSEKRAREVGIRKAIGSLRRQLVNQFLHESFVVVVMALLISLSMLFVVLPSFNELAGKEIKLPWSNLYFWIACLVFMIVTGLLAGSYPAFYLSSFAPVKVLKGTIRVGQRAALPRKVLVVFQFVISVALVIGTVVIYEQIQFAKDRPVGYQRSRLLMMEMTSFDYYPKYEVLKAELKNTGVVEEVSLSGGPTTRLWSSQGGFTWRGKDPAFQSDFATLQVNPEYGRTVGWEIAEGRDFSADLASDSAAFIITESAAKLMNLDDPVGEVVRWEPGWRPGGDFTIIGVIGNMVMESPFNNTMPGIFFLQDFGSCINIRITPKAGVRDALAKIEGVFRQIVPDVPFEYKFADQDYALKFAAEERIGKLASLFATLAILISCLGLFGLSAFMAEQRTKEIGIRKVVGASVWNLCRMLSVDFMLLVMIACVIAGPLAYLFLEGWLVNFQYRTEISPWLFVWVGTGSLIITLATISYQALKAARMNPVKCLRAE